MQSIFCALDDGRSQIETTTHPPLRSTTIHYDLRRPTTDMDLRNPFSKPFKKLKDKFPGGSRKRDGRSGGKDGRIRKEADTEGGEVSQRNSYLRSEVSVEDVVDSGPSAEGSNIDGILVDPNPPTSTPMISHAGEPDGKRIMSFLVLPLMGPPRQCPQPRHP